MNSETKNSLGMTIAEYQKFIAEIEAVSKQNEDAEYREQRKANEYLSELLRYLRTASETEAGRALVAQLRSALEDRDGDE